MSSPVRSWISPMRARSSQEPHRASTPLEAFFDLCFVVAVAAAGVPLHHSLVEHRVAFGVGHFLLVFFAIWWAWMNFTWFASAYDTDDDVYRITTLVQIAGALVLAAGIEPAFDNGDFRVVTIGYVIMRLALVGQWLRAARADRERRPVALRYAVGVAIVQVLWILRLLLPDALLLAAFLALVVAELAVPIWAERARGGPTTFHPHHIVERYGLFTLIVLGETVSAATLAVRGVLDQGGHETAPLLELAVAGLVIVFALWWIYFDRSAHNLLNTLRGSMMWGYGHYFIFAAAAAVGAGLSVAVDHATEAAEISDTLNGYAVAVPVAVYLFFVWLLHLRPHQSGPMLVVFPVGTVLILLAPLGPESIKVIAGILVVLVAILVTLGRRVPDPVG
ncbi:low temperature requirement protein A [Actinoplanes sp. NPDC051411]|uniref:low temperature requirement protein A n=1 Tax=Actinoplanes sp. NPDC051411 TaxID=3155522 RepID=UPI0034362FE5